jgi:hypothetical protein
MIFFICLRKWFAFEGNKNAPSQWAAGANFAFSDCSEGIASHSCMTYSMRPKRREDVWRPIETGKIKTHHVTKT